MNIEKSVGSLPVDISISPFIFLSKHSWKRRIWKCELICGEEIFSCNVILIGYLQGLRAGRWETWYKGTDKTT